MKFRCDRLRENPIYLGKFSLRCIVIGGDHRSGFMGVSTP